MRGRGTDAEQVWGAGGNRLNLVEKERPVELIPHSIADVSNVEDTGVGAG